MPNTELHDLVVSLGGVYWQDPLVPEGYVLSGSNVTHVVNLVDGVQIAKIGSDTIGLGEMCTQPCFVYNPQPASGSGNPAIRRTGYGTVVNCLQADYTLFFVTDDTISILYSWDGTGTITAADSVVHAIVGDGGATFTAQLTHTWGSSGGQTKTVTGISKTHHVFEWSSSYSGNSWALRVDGVVVGSGAWTSPGAPPAWTTTTSAFQSGAPSVGPDSSSVDHRAGQMALFPSVLSASDRALVRDAMYLIMCNGHPTGDNAPWWGTEF